MPDEKPRDKRRGERLPHERQPIGDSRLTVKQRRFIRAYLADPDLDAKRAAIAAGYQPSTARQTAYRLMKKPHIAAAIEEAQERRAEIFEYEAVNVLCELARIAFADPRAFFREDGSLKSPSELSKEDASILQSYRRVVRFDRNGDPHTINESIAWKGKLQALELLGKHLGLFSESVNVKHDLNPNVLESILTEVERHRSDIIDSHSIEAAATGDDSYKSLPHHDENDHPTVP